MQIVETARGRKSGRLWIEFSAFTNGARTEHERTGETYDCGACPDRHPVEIPRDEPLRSVVLVAESADGDEATIAAALRQAAEAQLAGT